jgi:hypothetical protein
MALYYGVGHDNRIELRGGARLVEGTRVEVHAPRADDLAAAEEEAKARLRAAGLLAPAPEPNDADE